MILTDAITMDYDGKSDEVSFDESKDANIPTENDEDEIVIRR